jgi:hypothetical protein
MQLLNETALHNLTESKEVDCSEQFALAFAR